MMLALVIIGVLAPIVLGQFNHDPNIWDGRTTYVHLFEWKWTDIAAECERFLAPKGFAAVQAQLVRQMNTGSSPMRAIRSRGGKDTSQIYVDTVINHMAGGEGIGSAGNRYNSGTEMYPGVPFGPRDFTDRNDCPSTHYDDQTLGNCWRENICHYSNAEDVRNCRLSGMPDIAIYKSHSRDMILKYLNKLVDIGVAGFRVDAAKHMWPSHLKELISRVRNLNEKWFAKDARPFIFHEVIDLGHGEPITSHQYVETGRVTEFKYGMELSRAVLKKTGLKLSHLEFFGILWPGFLNGMSAVTFIDNHDNQRGHGGGGEILTFRQSREYKIANAFMLAHPYGYPQVMGSYNWPQKINSHGKDENDWIGPPSGSNGAISAITINQDGTCHGEWRCEHRWRQITNMVGFRNVARFGDLVHWWTNNENQIAFGRGVAGSTTAFIVINNDNWALSQYLQTGLPPGVYCDIFSGKLKNESCTGRTVTVNGDRGAQFNVPNDGDPVVAIHINAKIA